MTEFSDLQQRALDIQELFAAKEPEKYGRHWTREELVMGFVTDVGDLVKLVMTKAGIRDKKDDLDEKIGHELADCLWSVFVLADKYNINLEAAFTKTMDELAAKLQDKVA